MQHTSGHAYGGIVIQQILRKSRSPLTSMSYNDEIDALQSTMDVFHQLGENRGVLWNLHVQICAMIE